MRDDQLLMQTIIKGIEEAKVGIDSIQRHQFKSDIAVNDISNKVEVLKEKVEELNVVVRKGNGEKSVVNKIKDIEDVVGKLKKYLDAAEQADKEKLRGSFMIKVALITGVGGLLSSAIAAIVVMFG